MSDGEFSSVILQLLLLITAAHVFGWLFMRLQQPRVIGEIFAGVLLGPSILGHFAPTISTAIFSTGTGGSRTEYGAILSFLYNLGLLLLLDFRHGQLDGNGGRLIAKVFVSVLLPQITADQRDMHTDHDGCRH